LKLESGGRPTRRAWWHTVGFETLNRFAISVTVRPWAKSWATRSRVDARAAPSLLSVAIDRRSTGFPS